MPQDRYDEENERLMKLRLLAEGAEEMFLESLPLFRLGLKNNAVRASIAFDLVGMAVSEIRVGIRDMQESRTQEELGKK